MPTPTDDTAAGAPKKNPPRFTVPYIEQTGLVDESKITADTKAKLIRAVQHLVPPAGAVTEPPAPQMTLKAAAGAVDSIGAFLERLALMKGHTPERARLMRFTPEEHAAIDEPMMAVMQKYLGTSKYEAEIVLALTLGTALFGKVQILTAPAGDVIGFQRPVEQPETQTATGL